MAMQITILLCLLVPLVFSGKVSSQIKHDDWQRADEDTIRLSPSAFTNLPPNVRQELESRACTIPQPYNAGAKKENVISGKFGPGAETGWAVLCSRRRRSAILIFHGDHWKEVEEIGEQSDVDSLQTVSETSQIGYSRQLSPIAPALLHKRLLKRAHSIRTIDHDGIEDTFIMKGSIIWYRTEEQWVNVPGGD